MTRRWTRARSQSPIPASADQAGEQLAEHGQVSRFGRRDMGLRWTARSLRSPFDRLVFGRLSLPAGLGRVGGFVDETELDQLDESLRRVCHENDLSWVAESVDTAIRDRISESVNPGSSAYHRRGEVWAGGFSYDDDGSAQPNPQIVEREYGQQERILLLVDSILGVYRDLPDIETETLRVLNQGFDGRVRLPSRLCGRVRTTSARQISSSPTSRISISNRGCGSWTSCYASAARFWHEYARGRSDR